MACGPRMIAYFCQLVYASDLFYLTALFVSRIAVLCLLFALGPYHWHKVWTACGIIADMLMAVAALLMIAVGCDVKMPWTQISQECGSIVSVVVRLRLTFESNIMFARLPDG